MLALSEFCGAINRSGLRRIRYVPINFVNPQTWDFAINTQGLRLSGPDITTGDWLTLYADPRSQSFQQNSDDDGHGGYYSPQLDFTVPSLRQEAERVLHNMRAYRYIVEYTDAQGRRWLAGNPWHGLEFQYNSDNPQTGGLAAYKCSFRGDVNEPVSGYI